MKWQISKPLAVSIAVNLMLVGYLLGDGMRQFTASRFGPLPMPGLPFGAAPGWLESLPEEKASKVRNTFRQIMRDKETRFAEMQEAQARLRKIIAAEHFDEAELRAVLGALLLELDATRQQAIERFILLLRDFTPEERATFARGLNHPFPFGGPPIFMPQRLGHTGPEGMGGAPHGMPPQRGFEPLRKNFEK